MTWNAPGLFMSLRGDLSLQPIDSDHTQLTLRPPIRLMAKGMAGGQRPRSGDSGQALPRLDPDFPFLSLVGCGGPLPNPLVTFAPTG